MSYPPGLRYSWYIIAIDYNVHSDNNNFREQGVCDDGDEWHRIADVVQPCNVLVKFNRDDYPPPE